jgi:hypothetical protein
VDNRNFFFFIKILSEGLEDSVLEVLDLTPSMYPTPKKRKNLTGKEKPFEYAFE